MQRAGSDPTQPDHKGVGLVLRVQVLKARQLAPKDKSGTSDPYLVLTLGESKEATSTVYKSLDPEWNQTFEFPIQAGDAALLEVICWDKDRFRKEYMGELDVILEDVFHAGTIAPEPQWYALESRRTGRKRKKKDGNVSGEIQLKFALRDPANPTASAQQVLRKFHGVVAAPAGDDEESSAHDRDMSGEEEDDDDDDDDKLRSADEEEALKTPGGTAEDAKAARRRQKKLAKLRRQKRLKAYEFSGASSVAGVLFLEISRITDLPPEKNSTRTTFDMDPFVVTSLGKKTYRTRVINHNLNPVFDEKLVFQVAKHEVNYSLSFTVIDRDKFSGNDFVGTTTFPLSQFEAAAPEADPETGLYLLPDPETLTEREAERQIQTKKKRWPLSRAASSNNLSRMNSSNNIHKLNKTASSSSLRDGQLTPATPSLRPGLKRQNTDGEYDYLTAGNMEKRPIPTSAPSTSSVLPNSDSGGAPNHAAFADDPDLVSYELPLELKNKQRWHDKHHPVLYIRAKYLPYRALRQQFWRVMLKQYDTEESGKVEKVELVTMLDTLGSTLHNSTIDGFFSRWEETNRMNGVARKDGHRVLTMDQAVICLEEQLMKSREVHSLLHRPHWERDLSTRSNLSVPAAMHTSSSSPDESPGGTTPQLRGVDSSRDPSQVIRTPSGTTLQLDPAGPFFEINDLSGEPVDMDTLSGTTTPGVSLMSSSITRTDSWESEAELHDEESREEHVVEIQECPICHMPRLTRGGRQRVATDADIITHIATCASSDWRAVNNLVMAGFVTSSQAQRKWYSKVVTKIGYGGYKLGANSANILVQDRVTGMINEERMSVYVSLLRMLPPITPLTSHHHTAGPAWNSTSLQRPQEPRDGEEAK